MIFLQCKFEKTMCSFAKEEYLRLSFSSNAKHIEDKYIKIKKLNSRTLHINEEKKTLVKNTWILSWQWSIHFSIKISGDHKEQLHQNKKLFISRH